MNYISTNPSTGKLLKRFQSLSEQELGQKVSQSGFAFDINRTSAFNIRAKRITALSELLLQRKEALALLASEEMGKPIKEALAEIEKCATVCDYYAENAKTFLEDETVQSPFNQSLIQYAPLGVVLGIMPWNFPYWQVFRFAIPALMSGNSVLVKHAPNVPQCAQAIEQLFKDVHFPEGLYQNIYATEEQITSLIQHEKIQGIAFTGSLKTGRNIASQAGQAIKKTVLELGGNDAFIVLAEANLKDASQTAVRSRMMNSGQSCIAAKRWIVDQIVAEPFIELVQQQVAQLVMGDPTDPNTDIGPMARYDIRDKVVEQINQSVAKGAKVISGGQALQGHGYFIPPTILTHVQPGMPAFDEEVFGPVASIIVAENTHHAIELANQSQYGLGAAIWTTDQSKAIRFAKQLQTGSVFINGMVQSNVHLPFGGTKNSGYGRELGLQGIREFVNVKSIVSN